MNTSEISEVLPVSIPLKHRLPFQNVHSSGYFSTTWENFSKLRSHDSTRAKYHTAKTKRSLFRERELTEERAKSEANFQLSGNADPTFAGYLFPYHVFLSKPLFLTIVSICHHILLFSCELLRLYWTQVSLGTPSRTFSVQIDTGSDVLWIPCDPCTACPSSSEIVVRSPFLHIFLYPTQTPLNLPHFPSPFPWSRNYPPHFPPKIQAALVPLPATPPSVAISRGSILPSGPPALQLTTMIAFINSGTALYMISQLVPSSVLFFNPCTRLKEDCLG